MKLINDTAMSHIGAFLLGIFTTVMFYVGATSPIEENLAIEPDRAKALTGAVFFADITQNNKLALVRDPAFFAFATTTEVSTTTVSATATLQYENDFEEIVEVYTPIVEEEKEEVFEVVVVPEVEVVVEEEEKVLPEGVYVLANGEYVDKNGDKISGDPFSYNYQPPPEEETFTTPGGVVMNRFGVILSTPDVVDESKVLIPPTIVDPENPPSTISPIYIPRYVLAAINQNPFLNCTQMQLFLNDKALCELYQARADDYEWIRVDEIDE